MEEDGPDIPNELLDAIGWSSDEESGPVRRRCPPKVGQAVAHSEPDGDANEVRLDAAKCASMYYAAFVPRARVLGLTRLSLRVCYTRLDSGHESSSRRRRLQMDG